MNQLAFSRACACAYARGFVCGVGCKSFFLNCWVISPNDEGGAPYMEMGILLFYFASSCRYEEEGEEEEELSPLSDEIWMDEGWMDDDDPRIDGLIAATAAVTVIVEDDLRGRYSKGIKGY